MCCADATLCLAYCSPLFFHQILDSSQSLLQVLKRDSVALDEQ